MLAIKNIVIGIQKTFESLFGRLHMTDEERTSELEDMTIQTSKTEE